MLLLTVVVRGNQC